MLKIKYIVIISVLLVLIFPKHIRPQGYDITIYLNFISDFSNSFETGEEWENVNESDVRDYIISRVTNDFSTYGISVSTNSGNVKVKIGVLKSDKNYFGLAKSGIGSFIKWFDYQGIVEAEVYSNNFSKWSEWQGDNATVSRIGEAIAGCISHEAGHLLNLYHSYMFSSFNPTIEGALDNDYYPKEPADLPAVCKQDPIRYEHIMATGSGAFYISLEQRATINRYFTINNSTQILNFVTDGGGVVEWDMTWGIRLKKFSLKRDVMVDPGKTLIISEGDYEHDYNGYTMDGGTIIIYGMPDPKNLTIGNVSNGIYLNWNSSDNATNYKIYKKIECGNYSNLIQISHTFYTDTDVLQNNSYYYYITPVNE